MLFNHSPGQFHTKHVYPVKLARKHRKLLKKVDEIEESNWKDTHTNRHEIGNIRIQIGKKLEICTEKRQESQFTFT